MKNITTPLTDEIIQTLKAGDEILLSGVIYTARDVAHKRLCDLIEKGEKLPVELAGQILYFTGPTPAQPGHPVGSAGPTTSTRMDAFSPTLMAHGLKGMIGKGNRSIEVIDAMKQHHAVYFAATGGAGALIAQHIKTSEIVCFDDLGPEAIRKMTVEDFPLVVAIDIKGNNLFITGPAKYKTSSKV
ncbi:MAG: fumarate hydratase [Gammaproteobacteria bacterium GWE2_42_36]|nr:MAG: fumarate hydratase [Gammaproteobacteria bacterium GWE2_42_36]HCU04773.1 Fe-S-containing hydro-lyase [Coxiellaceae bacterium]